MSQHLLLAVFVLFSSSVKQSFRSLTFDVFTWPIFSNDLDRDTISPQIVRGIRLFKKIAIVFGSSFCPIFFSLRNANDDDDDDDVSPRLLLASSFSYFFSSSSFSMVRSNTSSSIGFVTNMAVSVCNNNNNNNNNWCRMPLLLLVLVLFLLLLAVSRD